MGVCKLSNMNIFVVILNSFLNNGEHGYVNGLERHFKESPAVCMERDHFGV